MQSEKIILFLILVFGVAILANLNFSTQYKQKQQFVELGKSFLQFRLDLPGNKSQWPDASYFNGHTYWPQGFFPAVTLLPFLLLDLPVSQGAVQFSLNLLNFLLLYKIALKITGNKKTSLWLSFGYIFSTAYLVVGLFPWSWWFAQVVATSALLSALYYFFYGRKWFLIGLFLACALATRIGLVLSSAFFILVIVFSKQSLKGKTRELYFLCLPVLAGLFIAGLYNYLRFGSFLEFGYLFHLPALPAAREALNVFGTWNVFYYPTNFYYLFLKGPEAVYLPGTKYLIYPFLKPENWGMSIFLTSPVFIWCFKSFRKNKITIFASITSVMILLFLLGYFGVGTRQYGYRYALDFYPFLFIILCYSFKKSLSTAVKILLVVSFLLNLYLFPGIFVDIQAPDI